jgi:predicted house-cleaning noncanonical NTP pyrophosphatase (MazG superfamily)
MNASAGESSKKRRAKLPERRLEPLNPIIYVDAGAVRTLTREDISPEQVGWKAYGLSALPQEWVPKFLVISADSFTSATAEKQLADVLDGALSQVGIKGALVMLRSSGTGETIAHRGRLASTVCAPRDTAPAIRKVIETLPQSIQGRVHWVVQEYVQPQRQGHLSNERHVSYEKRDWVAEVEPRESPAYSMPIAIRRWRDGARISSPSLDCTSEIEISFCLKRVAMWAESLRSRMHFEWVWNGSALRVVQADIADLTGGVDPHRLVPDEIPTIAVDDLSSFKTATEKEYQAYGKLRNARLYRALGYEMPTFYVLDAPKQLKAILGGALPEGVRRDLEKLTKRPLILRTDGRNIPIEKREMLPRSDELRTVAEAEAWLINSFRTRIRDSALEDSSLCLLGHHFIPSIASAWARAEPGRRFVRIEALWGLPEGLYWYSHDTYEVDTRDVTLRPAKPGTKVNYGVSERKRFKGTFVAPDSDGNWIPYQTKVPFDWRSCVSKRSWLFEIAHTTRLIADHEQYPAAVMWFIGNHPASASHSVLPWFHNRSPMSETPKRAAPRRKLTIAGDFQLRTTSDWDDLRRLVGNGKRFERAIVEPTDHLLIRNRDFVRELASFAKQNKIVIELAGAVLSHAYYILQREGAPVECTDLFGTEEDVVEYNKLVRDKIPAIIEARGERVEIVRLSGDALISALRQKLVEESLEALDAKSGDDLVGELADVEEVISGLRHALRLTETQIESERVDKEKRRGGFRKGYMLTKTSTPHSLPRIKPSDATLNLDLSGGGAATISRSEDIPSSAIYRRPDLRHVEDEVEKIFAFETEIRKVTGLEETVNFSLPINSDGSSREFSLTVEIRRKGPSLRSTVRLRVRPSQLVLDFPDSQLAFDFRG